MKKENNKKRILVLNYEFPPLGGGASPVSYEIAKRLSETKEFDIDVVTMGFKKLAKYQKINDNLRVHRVKCWRSKKEICHPWEQLTYLISGYFKCRELLKKNKYDICHCHFIIPTGILALKLKNKFRNGGHRSHAIFLRLSLDRRRFSRKRNPALAAFLAADVSEHNAHMFIQFLLYADY